MGCLAYSIFLYCFNCVFMTHLGDVIFFSGLLLATIIDINFDFAFVIDDQESDMMSIELKFVLMLMLMFV